MEASLSCGPSLGTTPKKGTKAKKVPLRKPSAATGTVDTESAAAAAAVGDAAVEPEVEPDAIRQKVDDKDNDEDDESVPSLDPLRTVVLSADMQAEVNRLVAKGKAEYMREHLGMTPSTVSTKTIPSPEQLGRIPNPNVKDVPIKRFGQLARVSSARLLNFIWPLRLTRLTWLP
jgi:hypothetical protein